MIEKLIKKRHQNKELTMEEQHFVSQFFNLSRLPEDIKNQIIKRVYPPKTTTNTKGSLIKHHGDGRISWDNRGAKLV